MILRDVEVGGRAGLDVRIADGRIAEIGPRLAARRGVDELHAAGGALIPGLADHHIHLFALAAQAASVDVADAAGPQAFATQVGQALAARPRDAWLRVTGYHERIAGELTRESLDKLAPHHPIRVQHQTGALWILNGAALAALGQGDDPPGLERATGRLWRGDAWLRARIAEGPPPLAPIGRQLAAFGVTAVTDASVTTDQAAADRLAEAVRSGALPQRLTLMSGGELAAPADGAFALGAVKVLLDEHDLPDLDAFTQRIAAARAWGRKVAVHCVTAAELALTLAAFAAAGAEPGDRIEHGGMIPEAAMAALEALGLIVVTQPPFVRERGDRYLADVPLAEHADLYRCASLLAAGVGVAGSSDAPYAAPDPWAGIAAATDRRTRSGAALGAGERVPATRALELYLGRASDPAGPPRRVAVAEPADLCLLRGPLAEVLAEPSAAQVRATFVGGRLVHGAAA